MGMFESIFKKKPASYQGQTQFKMLNGYNPTFSSFGSDPYTSDVVRSAIHTIASNAGKLKPKHIRKVEGQVKNTNSYIEYILSNQPNEFMNTYDFIYKIVTQRELKNNAFVYIMSDGFGKITGFYPVNYSQIEMMDVGGEVYARFSFLGGKQVILPYKELIHIRKFYNENDLYGENNGQSLLPTLELINTVDQGIINGVKNSANLRGILKFSNSMLSPENIKKQRDEFVEQYMGYTNNGGIGALDSKAEFIPTNFQTNLVNENQMKFIQEKVYKYFNVNEDIIMSKFDDKIGNAFYENVIEPISLQMSLEFTNKLFTNKEKGFGNEILFSGNRLQYASLSSKVTMLKELAPLGLMTINEGRDTLNFEPVEGGDKRIQTLNVVNADKADQYQGVKGGDTNGDTKQGI